MIRPRFQLALTLVAVAAIAASVAPAPARAGLACTLQATSPSAPTPGPLVTHVRVGEDVLLEGQFPANTEVTLTFNHDASIVDEQVVTVGADGVLSLVVVFEPLEIGSWGIFAEAPSVPCGVVVSLLVEPAGPHVPVGVATYLCPVDIQSAEDIPAPDSSSACALALFPADVPAVPAGYTSNVTEVEYGLHLRSSDGVERSHVTAILDGGGTCDPATLHCTFDHSYRWDLVSAGEAELRFGTGPAGYHPGHVTVSNASGVADLDAARVTFDVPEQGQALVSVYWFADTSTTPVPTPAPTPVALPDTSTEAPAVGPLPSLPALLLVIAMVGASGVLAIARSRR